MKVKIDDLDFAKLKKNPTRYFDSPSEVLFDGRIVLDEKIAILKQWKEDVHLKQVADQENMVGENSAQELAEVSRALELILRTYPDRNLGS